MIVVIIAGGSGTRLWPLSTPDRPKHLLNLMGEESFLQGTYRRAKELSEHVYVITEKGHAHLVREQLPELTDETCIAEPGRRGTMACLLAGLHAVAARHDRNEPIAFMAADHYIRDTQGFVASFKIAADASIAHKKVVLVGIEPIYPSTAFGYINKGQAIEGEQLVYDVAAFKEKPPFAIAQDYVRSGEYLWNCSYFVGSVDTFARDIAAYSPQWHEYFEQLQATTDKESYETTYLSFETDTIDYALSEHVPPKTFCMVPASFDWMDLGSFQDAHDAVESNEAGNHIAGEHIATLEVENSFIRNHEIGKPVVVIGLDNVVVVNTPHGLLVARKDISQKVKEAITKLQDEKA